MAEVKQDLNDILKILDKVDKKFTKIGESSKKAFQDIDKRTLKDVEAAEKAITDLTKATNQLEQTKKDQKKLNDAISKQKIQESKLNQDLEKEAQQKIKTQRESIKNSQEEQKLLQQKLRTEKQELDLDQRKKKQLTDLEKAQQRLKKATSEEAFEIEKLNQKTNEARKQNRERIRQSKSLTPLYDAERKKLAQLQNQLAETALRTGATSKETRKLAKQVTTLNNRITGAEQLGGRFQRQVGKYPQLLKSTALAFGGAYIGVQAFVNGIIGAVNTAKQFEQSSANLAAILGTTREETTALTADALRLGSATAFTANQVTELQTEYAKLGFSEKEILNATEATLNLASATGEGLGESAAVAGAVLGGLGLEATETQRVVDVMAKSFSSSALDLEKFRESTKDSAPAARAVGVEIEELTSLLGVLSNAGISGSKAGTALRRTFIELNKAGLSLDEAYEKVNNSTDKLGTATELVGDKASSAFLILAEGKQEVADLEVTLRNAGGAAEIMAREQLDTLEGSLKLLDSAFEGFILSVFESDGVLNKLTRGFVDATASLFSLLTVKKDAVKINYESAKSLLSEANESSNLLDEYEALTSDGLIPTSEEKEKLDLITLKLKDRLGESVASIDAETGALKLNTEAVRAAIKAKRLAFDDEASQLASRLKGVQEEIKLLELNQKTALRQVELRKRIVAEAKKASVQEFEDSGGGIQFTVGTTETQKAVKKAQEELGKAYRERNMNIKLLNENREKERDILEKLSDLNFNANDIELLFNKTKKESIETTETQITTLNSLNAELSELKQIRGEINIDDKEALKLNKQAIINKQKEIDLIEGRIKASKKEKDTFLANEKRRIELLDEGYLKEIELEELRFNQELKKAKENGEDLELVELLHQKKLKEIRDKFQTEKVESIKRETKVERELNTTSGDELLKKEEERRKKELEAEELAQKRRQELISASTDIISDIYKKQSNERIKDLDDQLNEISSNQDRLQALADKGSDKAFAELERASKKEAELRKEREEELRKQQIIEAGTAAFKVLAAKSESGDPNAFTNTIREIGAISAFVSTLSGFFDGTDNTGKGGSLKDSKGSITGYTHENEMVLNSKETNKLMSTYGISTRRELFAALKENASQKVMHATQITKNPYESNSEFLKKIDSLTKAINGISVDNTASYDAFRNAIIYNRGGKKSNKTGYILD